MKRLTLRASETTRHLDEVLSGICSVVCSKYGLRVDYCDDFNNGFLADLDGEVIYLATSLPPEEANFALLHLFGHTVQWNTSTRACELGALIISCPQQAPLTELIEYELEAHDFGFTLLQEAGASHLEDWYASASEADLQELVVYYATLSNGGEHRDSPTLRRPRALSIPFFVPVRCGSRISGGRVIAFPVF